MQKETNNKLKTAAENKHIQFNKSECDPPECNKVVTPKKNTNKIHLFLREEISKCDNPIKTFFICSKWHDLY